jgi:glycosyltransferase involved in cell wall biosynthesis
VGLAPANVKRHLAIAHAVKNRGGYFPRGSKVEVVYHPSNKTGFANKGEDYFFTASRFYPSKRIDMLIRAYRRTSVPYPLKIAGTGDELPRLKALAGDDQRIEFIGFVRDEELLELYSRAIAVPFIPQDEDFGYITLEAMMCQKPVITTRDAGGPLELVTHGYTGLVCDPTDAALAAAIEHVCHHREWARHQGVIARERVEKITWPSLFDVLLSDRTTATIKRSTRQKITVLNPFAVWPANSGGRYRVLSIYRALAEHVDVDLVTLGLPHEGDAVHHISEGLRELTVARSAPHFAADETWHTRMGMPVYDITTLDDIHLTPDYLTMLEASLKGSVLAIVSHPYMLTALKQVGYKAPWVHEAHNHEAALKLGMLKDTPHKAELVERVRHAEAECCREAALVFATCESDARALTAAYGVKPDAMLVVPNGTDTRRIRFATRGVRTKLKRRLNLPDRPIALFLASGHRPNLISAEALFKLAPQAPKVAFALVGNLADAYKGWLLPENVWRVGSVTEEARNVWLEAADIALNPTLFGGGTNLKLLDYFAAGAPVISTEIGVRGIEAKHREHLLVSEMDALLPAMNTVLTEREEVDQWVRNARTLVEREYEWRVIANRLFAQLSSRGLIPSK